MTRSLVQSDNQPITSLQSLHYYGQSIWLDYIRRSLINSGELQELVDSGKVQGVTSNPAIFQTAIAGSTDYDQVLNVLEQVQDRDALSIYEELAIADIQAAADILLPTYIRTQKQDGYVSLEVSPYLADKTAETIAEAHRLWQAVARPNLMIKVPATPEGIAAIEALIGNGINVNVTLLFSQSAYEKVADAYLAGLERFAAQGGNVSQVASVASFFISRIDTAIDGLLNAQLSANSDSHTCNFLRGLLGKSAIANAKLTYRKYQQLYTSPRWQKLAEKGAHPQRLLWASTGSKNPHYRDVVYVEELIGADTVNTVPPVTLAAFLDHGQPRLSLPEQIEAAEAVLLKLEQVGISLSQIADHLLQQGIKLFQDAFDALLSSVARKRETILGDQIDRMTYRLPPALDEAVQMHLFEWRQSGKIRRLWAQDASLWTDADENYWLGWLGITDDQLAHLDPLKQVVQAVRSRDFTHVVLLGMGGSSLGPEVMKQTFGKTPNFPELHILDSTDPAQIRAIESRINLPRTLFIVSSKSGSTLEPHIFKQYFFDRVQQMVGVEAAGQQFIAITDPGSQLQQIAINDRFYQTFLGLPCIGGRYSVLSNFGMVPAALMGVDIARFLRLTEEMVHSCAPSVPAEDNPGVVLGTILGVLAKQGYDKVTLTTSPSIASLGAWLEQLLAESTGKIGKGIIPIDQEALSTPEKYGRDRLFIYIRLESAPDLAQDAAIALLEQSGFPVVRIAVATPEHLGQEFFRWEIATAVAGAILEINPFDQPDVEASKIATKQLMLDYEKTRILSTAEPITTQLEIQIYSAPHDKDAFAKAAIENSLTSYLRSHLNRLKPGDYFALLAYIEMNPVYYECLQAIRHAIRDAKQVATCLGFGPRFLHSTGQVYKGGPNTGVFLQITNEPENDLDIPGQNYSFGVVKAAQAQGDFQVLAERNRRLLRLHLSQNTQADLELLQTAVRIALI